MGLLLPIPLGFLTCLIGGKYRPENPLWIRDDAKLWRCVHSANGRELYHIPSESSVVWVFVKDSQEKLDFKKYARVMAHSVWLSGRGGVPPSWLSNQQQAPQRGQSESFIKRLIRVAQRIWWVSEDPCPPQRRPIHTSSRESSKNTDVTFQMMGQSAELLYRLNLYLQFNLLRLTSSVNLVQNCYQLTMNVN